MGASEACRTWMLKLCARHPQTWREIQPSHKCFSWAGLLATAAPLQAAPSLRSPCMHERRVGNSACSSRVSCSVDVADAHGCVSQAQAWGLGTRCAACRTDYGSSARLALRMRDHGVRVLGARVALRAATPAGIAAGTVRGLPRGRLLLACGRARLVRLLCHWALERAVAATTLHTWIRHAKRGRAHDASATSVAPA